MLRQITLGRSWVGLISTVAAAVGLIWLLNANGVYPLAISASVPTPGPKAMTIYSVTNPGTGPITVQHVITNTLGFSYTFSSAVAASTTVEYHLRDIDGVPSPFNGSMTLYSDQPFSSEVVGYDYPLESTPTPTSTGTATASATPTETSTPWPATPTPTLTPTSLPNTPTSTKTPAPTLTPTPSPIAGQTIFEYYNTGDDGSRPIYGESLTGQTFTPSATHLLGSVRLKLVRRGNPGTVGVTLSAVNGKGQPTGPALSTGIIDGSLVSIAPANGKWYTISMTPAYLQVGVTYVVLVDASLGDANNLIRWRRNSNNPQYAGGNVDYTVNGGATWKRVLGTDMMFEEWGSQ